MNNQTRRGISETAKLRFFEAEEIINIPRSRKQLVQRTPTKKQEELLETETPITTGKEILTDSQVRDCWDNQKTQEDDLDLNLKIFETRLQEKEEEIQNETSEILIQISPIEPTEEKRPSSRKLNETEYNSGDQKETKESFETTVEITIPIRSKKDDKESTDTESKSSTKESENEEEKEIRREEEKERTKRFEEDEIEAIRIQEEEI